SYAANYELFGSLPRVSSDPETYPNADTDPNVSWASAYRIGSIPDGTSNTLTMAERFAVCPVPTPGGGNAWAYPAPYSPPYAAPRSATSTAPTAAGAVTPPPQANATPPTADYRRVQTTHGTSIVVGLADGSSRLVSTNVSQATWQAAVRPDDHVPLGTDW